MLRNQSGFQRTPGAAALGADSYFVVWQQASPQRSTCLQVLLEISCVNSCDGNLPASIPWLTTGPFEGSKGGVFGFKMLSTCTGFISLGSTLGNSLGASR